MSRTVARRAWHNVITTSFTLSAPILDNPLDATDTGDLTPSFTWNAVNGAITYEIQISNDIAFTDIINSDTEIGVTAYTPPSDITIGGNIVYWRVRADTPSIGNWSETRSLVYDLDMLIAAFGALLAHTLNISAGTAIDNAGTLGSAHDGTLALGLGTLEQDVCDETAAGIFFAGNDGTAGNRTIINMPATDSGDYADLASYSVMFIGDFDSSGTSNNGSVFRIGSFDWRFNANATRFRVGRPAATTAPANDAQNITTQGGVPLAAGNCYIGILTYGEVANKFRQYFGMKGDTAITPATDFVNDIAAVGAITAVDGTAMGWGNRITTLSQGWHGTLYKLAWFPSVLSSAQKQALLVCA